MWSRGTVWLLCGALSGCSCGDDLPAADDAAPGGDGGQLFDAGVGPDATAPLIWIDFSITGCASGAGVAAGGIDAGPDQPDAGADLPCHGDAPLRLQFVPVAPAAVTLYEWTFGDGSEPDDHAAPEHVYTEAGVYDVALSAQGPGGTAGVSKLAIVVVGPAAIGAPCDDDAQCASGTCACEGGACDGFARGFCTVACSDVAPCAAGVCADLAPGAPPAPDEWQQRLCLPDCATGETCRDGAVCRELLRGDDDGWVSACFPAGFLGDLGDSCVTANGDLRDELCASGTCLAEGQRGVCSAPCGAGAPCPASAACATFEGGSPGPSCLARCDEDTACDADPWLACAAPGGVGAKDFTVDEVTAEGGYCAPKPCEGPSDCAPLGACNAGFCGP